MGQDGAEAETGGNGSGDPDRRAGALKIMGHEQTSTILNCCTHLSPTYVNRVRDVFADLPLTVADDDGPETNQATDDSAA